MFSGMGLEWVWPQPHLHVCASPVPLGARHEVCLMAMPVAVQGCGGQEHRGVCEYLQWVPVPVGVLQGPGQCCWGDRLLLVFVQIGNISYQHLHVSDSMHLSVGRQCQGKKSSHLEALTNQCENYRGAGCQGLTSPEVPGPSWLPRSQPGNFPALLLTPLPQKPPRTGTLTLREQASFAQLGSGLRRGTSFEGSLWGREREVTNSNSMLGMLM